MFFVVLTSSCRLGHGCAKKTVDGDSDADIGDIMLVASRWHTSCETPDTDSNPATPNYEAHLA